MTVQVSANNFSRPLAPFRLIWPDDLDRHIPGQVDASLAHLIRTAGGDNEVQRTMLEIVNQLDGFDSRGNIKVCANARWKMSSSCAPVQQLVT